MHNIGSTQTEYTGELGGQTGFEAEQFEYHEGEAGYETFESNGEHYESVLSPEAEAELATEFMGINTEAELDRFLGSLIKRVGRTVGGVIRSPIGRAVGGMLKGVARKALPMAGAALGNLVLPGVGGAIGGQLASAAGRMFGLELEGLSQEDREYEVARRFVQLAADVVRHAAQTPANIPPTQAAGQAIAAAAHRFAPGLLPAVQSAARTVAGVPGPAQRGGRWIRRGRAIIVLGA